MMKRELLKKYKPIQDFIEAMIERMEEAEKKYGDWRDIDDESVREHLISEIEEWAMNWQEPKEMIDIANCCFMLWCIYENPESWQEAQKIISQRRLLSTWPSYRYG